VTLTRLNKEAAEREHVLEEEIKTLRDKYRNAEARNEELASAVPEATRPLLRQIQQLQESITARTDAWNSLETTLKSRVREVELSYARLKVTITSFFKSITTGNNRFLIICALGWL
jgi:DNA repair ATPase RecN